MTRKHHNHKLQTTPWHREEEPLNHHETPGRQIKQSNQPRFFFCGSLVFFCFVVSCISHILASVHCCLVVTCWKRADLLALVGDVHCIFVTFPCSILSQVGYLIVSFPDLCRLSYFYNLWGLLVLKLPHRHFLMPFL